MSQRKVREGSGCGSRTVTNSDITASLSVTVVNLGACSMGAVVDLKPLALVRLPALGSAETSQWHLLSVHALELAL